MNFLNEKITRFITERMSKREFNTMKEIDAFAFGTPIVGFASASDPLFEFYKKHIDESFYRLPEEWMKVKYGKAFDRDNISILSYVLPQTEETKKLCRELSDCPAYEWQMVRVHGEECNRALASAVVDFLTEMGIEAVAPMCEESFSWGDSDKFHKISNWSERHTAHICGLGTFGLCDGLITPVGKAVRFGSVIFNAKVTATDRPYIEYNEYCLAKYGCRACIERCPANAISKSGHDKPKCIDYHREHIKPLCIERFSYDGYSVCGLCQTGVPCESGIPSKGLLK